MKLAKPVKLMPEALARREALAEPLIDGIGHIGDQVDRGRTLVKPGSPAATPSPNKALAGLAPRRVKN